MYTEVGSEKLLSRAEAQVDYYKQQLADLQSGITAESDPALQPLLTQVTNHLDQVGFSYRIATDSKDYPFELSPSMEPYPEAATHMAKYKAQRLLDLIEREPLDYALPEYLSGYRAKALAEQNKIAQALLANPMAVYEDFANDTNWHTANFHQIYSVNTSHRRQ